MAETPEENKKTKVVIFVHEDSEVADEEVMQLLDQLEIQIENPVIVNNEEQLADAMSPESILIVIIDHVTCESEDIDGMVMRVASNSADVILVFANNFEYEGLHPIAEKYGTQCGWSPIELSEKIGDPVSSIPTDSSAAAATRKDPKQVSC